MAPNQTTRTMETPALSAEAAMTSGLHEAASDMRPLDDRYLVGGRIGQGGVGVVYHGWQSALERPVAIKLLRPELTLTPAAVTRFEREARTTSLLNHPHVVTVIDIGRTAEDTHFVVMELLEGETLGDLLDREQTLESAHALDIARQMVRGMGAGQGVGLVHRDLKPDNIFLVDGHHVKVLDFGLATLREPGPARTDSATQAPYIPVDSDPSSTLDHPLTYDSQPDAPVPVPDSPQSEPRLTRPGALMGTPRYMAPEQVLGWAVDQRTDLYAFGVILFEMLAGHTPFQGPGSRDLLRQHLHDKPPHLTELVPGLSRPIADLVARLLAKSPSDRFQDWSSLAEALRKLEPERREPADARPRLLAAPLPAEPYRFLTPFTAATRGIFFGRDADTQRFREAWEHTERPAMVLLTGASGVGKTSFLSARVVPSLEDTGHRVVRVRGTARPLDQLARLATRELRDAAVHTPSEATLQPPDTLPELLDELRRFEGRPIAVVFDQLEEIFTQGDAAAAQAFQVGIAAVLAGADSRIRFILSLREDYLGATLRTLHPLPIDQLARTLPLRPLEASDIAAALAGPGEAGLPVKYAPFTYEDGLLDVIVDDLLSDAAGEVTPRIQAVGARLWEMARDRTPVCITFDDYRHRLNGAQGILARVLDEAIDGLDIADQGVAKEMLRVMTHLPGSPTSRPVPETELLSNTTDPVRRSMVLRQLEDRWRIIHGYQDPRLPGVRVVRIAHESLIARIQQYGEEGTDRNRARQLFHHGFDLWLKGGQRDEDLLAEQHFDEIQRHIDDLVLRSEEEDRFYRASAIRYDDHFLVRHKQERRKALLTRAQVFGLPTIVLAIGVIIGQALTSFAAVDRLLAQGFSLTSTPNADLAGAGLQSLRMRNGFLRGADLTGADLRDSDLANTDLQQAQLLAVRLAGSRLDGANLAGATIIAERLWDTSFVGADLRGATVWVDPEGADFAGAAFDRDTVWRFGEPAPCAMGPGAQLNNCQLPRLESVRRNLEGASADGVNLDGADLHDSRLNFSSMKGASLRGAILTDVQLVESDLSDAILVGADLRGARLHTANLQRVDFTGADLSSADLDGADLSAAIFCRTKLGPNSSRWVERWPTKTCPDSTDGSTKTSE